jgi:hypothetical protein
MNRRRFLHLLTGSAAGIALAPAFDLAAILDRSPSVLLAPERRIIAPWLLEPGWITRQMVTYLDAALVDTPRVLSLADHGFRQGDHLAYPGPRLLTYAVSSAFQRPRRMPLREVALDHQPCVRTVVTDKEQTLLSRDEFAERTLQPAAWALAQYVRDHRLDVFAPLDVPEWMQSSDVLGGVRASSPRGFPLRTLLHVRPDEHSTILTFDTLAGSIARALRPRVILHVSTQRS